MTIINGSDIKSWDPAITSGTFPGGPMDVLDAVYGFLVYVNAEGKVTGWHGRKPDQHGRHDLDAQASSRHEVHRRHGL